DGFLLSWQIQMTLLSINLPTFFIVYVFVFFSGLTTSDDISPDKLEMSSKEGQQVTLSCNYRTDSEYVRLYWYRQHSDQRLQYLLFQAARSSSGRHTSDTRYQSATSRDSTQLIIDSLTIADTAIYYCALRYSLCSRWRSFDLWGIHSNVSVISLITLILFSPECRAEDKVTQPTGDVTVFAGEAVTLSCSYETSITSPDLFWYIQYPNESPKYILRQSTYGNHTVPGYEERFTARLDQSTNTVPLTVQKVQLSDSAVYYCALKPTSLTLDYNLHT
uniref:Ig-like domain-containing protein n=1 Tax=Paramormyrops kingsleyae TaxID=1676925 RepID=A0A3B3Q373_9TELE